MRNVVFSLLFILACFQSCSAIDTLNFGENISQDTLVSVGRKFQLGFFSLPIESGINTTGLKKYLGIWYYNLEPKTVVWVANRNKPIVDSDGVFQIAHDGNLVVADASHSYWSTKLEASSSRIKGVKLLDSGNLVLMDDDQGYLWQSFQHPTDTFLPGMKMDINLTLRSWKNENDPGSGSFTFQKAQTGDPRSYRVNNQSQLYWAFDGLNLDKMFNIILYLLENTTSFSSYDTVLKRTIKHHSPFNYDKSRLLMNSSGEIQFWKWEDNIRWEKLSYRPSDKCDIHNYCGNFSSCNKNNLNLCKCLPGFHPRRLSDNDHGYLGQHMQGCVRKSSKECVTTTTNNNMIFVNLTKIKVGNPDQGFLSETEADCQSLCLNTCPCNAYSYNATYNDRSYFSCWIWTRELPTLQDEQDDGRGFSILVESSDIESTAKSCGPCGTYIIPYPLSTGPTCGDPTYNKFNCSLLTGQVSFMMPDGKSYRVTSIEEGGRKFYIQTNDTNRCDDSSSSSYQNDKASSPFNVTNWCFNNDEIEVNWAPAPEPQCDEFFGCKSWPHSTCIANSKGENRCHCDSKYTWNSSSLSCIKGSSRNHSTHPKPLTLAVICIVIIILTCTVVFAYMWRKKIGHKLDKVSIQIQESLHDSEKHVRDLIGLGNLEENDSESIEVPYYTFRSIQAATNNFADSNKLGQGGYGPVYKGRFPGGQEIAIKRLSSVSTQGLQEFKNEIVLIAKLQHRNLVRLRGYCIKGDEKILLYEYMSNKSLDTFIFDRTRTVLLSWKLRFDIIVGIARGMLYLHQDSRLRVIHRDLKTSNILLDDEMVPKISDFGLAKIFGGKETEASTQRVMGTYGYMSPEYALDGFFSIKSDVFSFGVVLLEILSGKKNTGFFRSQQISSLLGYAWRLWTENKLLDLMDSALSETCNENEFVKCAQIGLLCVQDEPGDRPTMSNILTMLDSETVTIPIPSQPTFFTTKHQSCSSSSSKLEISMHIDSSYQEGR